MTVAHQRQKKQNTFVYSGSAHLRFSDAEADGLTAQCSAPGVAFKRFCQLCVMTQTVDLEMRVRLPCVLEAGEMCLIWEFPTVTHGILLEFNSANGYCLLFWLLVTAARGNYMLMSLSMCRRRMQGI